MITDPSEEYFKDGLWGWTGTLWEKLKAFSNLLGIASHGWDGSDWRKDPLRFGFSANWFEDLGGTKSGDGTYWGYATVVPTGEVWIVDRVSIVNTSGTRNRVNHSIYDGSSWYLFYANSSPTQYIPDSTVGPITLAAGMRIRVRMNGCLDGDVIGAFVVGRKIYVTE